MIAAAREQWENDTDTAAISQTVKFYMPAFPASCFPLYLRPIQSITTIKYYDAANSLTTIDASVYSLNAADRMVHLAYNEVWPNTVARWDAVEVTYVAGYTSAPLVPAIARQAMLLLVGHYFENRDMVMNPALQSFNAYQSLVRRFMRSSYP